MDTQQTQQPAPGSPTRHNRRWLWVIIALVLVTVAIFAVRGLGPAGTSDVGSAQQYHCPMHPTVISDKPGDCPICGMKLVPFKTATAAADKATRYHCPMHPTVISDKPGDCPICGMKLVPMDKAGQGSQAEAPKKKIMYRSTMNPGEVSDKPGKDAMGMDMVPFEVTEGGTTSTIPGMAAVSITPQSRQIMGLKLGMVEKRPLTTDVRTSALIAADETRQYHVNVKVEGWIDTLFVAVTGQQVNKGDLLLTLYSPDLVSAQEEYLIALKAKDTPGGESLLAASKRRLQLWDISDQQIKELEKTGKAQRNMTLYAPVSGIVVDKQVLAGNKVMPDESLMTIADLSSVWGEADIYQSDLPYVKVGMLVELSLPYWPGQTFDGKVIFLSPTLDPESRTMRARLEIPNPKGNFKPGMYADARLFYQRGEKLCIPTTAVMFSGKGAYAFKDGGDGRLIPVAIKTGALGGDWYELLGGLKEGDRVVVSANFLVDSESNLKAALEAVTGGNDSALSTGSEQTDQQR